MAQPLRERAHRAVDPVGRLRPPWARDRDGASTAGARIVHVDVMDGHFVPNITIGPPVVAASRARVHERRRARRLHLMIERPSATSRLRRRRRRRRHGPSGGVPSPAPHARADPRGWGAAAGVALNPATPVETLDEARHHCDLVLVMSVNPGFGGQCSSPTSLDKVRRARAACRPGSLSRSTAASTPATLRELVEAGANLLVAGSSVFAAATRRVASASSPLRPARSERTAPAGRDVAVARRAARLAGLALEVRRYACVYSMHSTTAVRLQGGVKVPTGGESPRASREVDQVEFLGRRSESGWEKTRDDASAADPEARPCRGRSALWRTRGRRRSSRDDRHMDEAFDLAEKGRGRDAP